MGALRSVRGVAVDERLDGVFVEIDGGRAKPPARELLRLILLQSSVDRAGAIHIFMDTDDDMLRMQYCLAVPPDAKQCPCAPSGAGVAKDNGSGAVHTDNDPVLADPSNPDCERVWYEMVPPPAEVGPALFALLRWHAGMKAGETTGTLHMRFEGSDLAADVVTTAPDDFRIYFHDERPPIRPKLARQFDELCKRALDV